jgi:hypothetical protein
VSDLYVAATVDISDVEKGLDAAQRRGHNLKPAFAELKKPMRDDQRDHGKRQRGPFGSWARRSPNTLAFYRSHGRGRVPRPLGRLSTAVKYTATAFGLSGESRAKWSEAQQEGGTVGRGVRLRARPFLWLSTKLLDLTEEVIERTILGAYGGGR